MKNGLSLLLSFLILLLGLSALNIFSAPFWLLTTLTLFSLAIIWVVYAPLLNSVNVVLSRHNISSSSIWRMRQTIETLDDTIVEKIRAVERVPLQLAETVRKQEYVDTKTNLGNRRFFDARLDVFLVPDHRTGEGLLVLITLTGLDDLFGDEEQQKSDEVDLKKENIVQQSAILLENALKDYPYAVLSRRGKVDFAIFIHPIPKNQNEKIAAKLDQALRMLPLPSGFIADNFFHMGLVRVGTLATTRHDLLAKADLAMRNAQLRGSSGWFELEDDQETHARGMVQWRTLFESTINQQRVRLFVQPIEHFQSHNIIHSEIFARLVDENGSDINADEFIPMALACGFLDRLDRLVVDQVIKWMLYQDQTQHAVCVNVSVSSLLTPKFLDWLIQRLSTKPSLINNFIVEFAERPMSGEEDRLELAILKLKELGVKVGIDHVGEQLVTLDYLEKFSIDYAKIHRSVISKIGQNNKQHEEILIESLAQVAQSKGFNLYAEGVESSRQLDRLIQDGVTGGQGYLLGTPIPLKQMQSHPH